MGTTANSRTRCEVHVKGFSVRGGDAGYGGGGGTGAGGAIYVQDGSTTIDRCPFEGKSAEDGGGDSGIHKRVAVIAVRG